MKDFRCQLINSVIVLLAAIRCVIFLLISSSRAILYLFLTETNEFLNNPVPHLLMYRTKDSETTGVKNPLLD